MLGFNPDNVTKVGTREYISLFILLPALLALFIAYSLLSIFGYIDNTQEALSKELEKEFIDSPVEILDKNGQYNHQVNLYSYEESKEITRYGIVQSHKLSGGDKMKPIQLNEKEEILKGVALIDNPHVLLIGGYNPSIASTIHISAEGEKDRFWKREITLPFDDTFLIVQEAPIDFKESKYTITYLDDKGNDVTEEIQKVNQIFQ